METREMQIDREGQRLRSFQHQADAISHLIVNTDLPWVDIAIEVERLRAEAQHLFPLKMGLFELIYESRFHRLWAQWRGERTDG
jgi:hypothetical protein